MKCKKQQPFEIGSLFAGYQINGINYFYSIAIPIENMLHTHFALMCTSFVPKHVFWSELSCLQHVFLSTVICKHVNENYTTSVALNFTVNWI